MASSKEMQHSSRPISSQHRPSMSGALPRPAHSRVHSHSVSSGSLVPPHRVTRRKSVTSTANNVAAMVAAVTDSPMPINMPISTRRALSKNRSAGLPSPPPSLSNNRIGMKRERDENAIDSNDEDESQDDNRAKNRRASESAPKEKRSGGELRCDKCGKGYKHSSCLSKHLWEHTPEWSFTSKLLISKHQQVQLLEAASVLLTMNQGALTPPDSAKDFESDNQDGSRSPTSSSGQQEMSSADTTPPPEHIHTYGSYRSKRYSSGSGHSGNSRSYQFASAYPYGSVPSHYRHSRQQSSERRPTSAGLSQNREDDGLAAAVELLSCSFGSAGQPRTMPVTVPSDTPPVPNIPAQYLGHESYESVLTTSLRPRQTESYTRHHAHSDVDVKMDENSADDDFSSQRSRDPSDEDDDGIFGRMEE